MNISARKQAREYMMTVLFQMEGTKDFSQENREKYLSDPAAVRDENYSIELFDSFVENKESIDEIINKSSKGWTTNRMAKADLAILRLATCEIKYIEDVPNAVSIDEAVELSKKYGTDSSSKFVNAVLGQVNSIE